MITFKTQYEKLVKAYISDKVEPNESGACFIGNLLNGAGEWMCFKHAVYWQSRDAEVQNALFVIQQESDNTYTPKELLQIEGAFMRVWRRYGENEESLFKAFEHALMLLRKLHESKGEVIEDYGFKKRELACV